MAEIPMTVRGMIESVSVRRSDFLPNRQYSAGFLLSLDEEQEFPAHGRQKQSLKRIPVSIDFLRTVGRHSYDKSRHGAQPEFDLNGLRCDVGGYWNDELNVFQAYSLVAEPKIGWRFVGRDSVEARKRRKERWRKFGRIAFIVLLILIVGGSALLGTEGGNRFLDTLFGQGSVDRFFNNLGSGG